MILTGLKNALARFLIIEKMLKETKYIIKAINPDKNEWMNDVRNELPKIKINEHINEWFLIKFQPKSN
jgi:hypothetical protein